MEDIEGMKGKRENLLQINDLMVKLMEKDAEKSNQGDKSEGKQSDNWNELDGSLWMVPYETTSFINRN